ncbi:MAG: hypothetical protein ACLPKE_03745 [Streptosporangiaceae bacterium]
MAGARRIVIVGGGIAGLSLAITRRVGAAPELVERSQGWPAAGAGIILPAHPDP